MATEATKALGQAWTAPVRNVARQAQLRALTNAAFKLLCPNWVSKHQARAVSWGKRKGAGSLFLIKQNNSFRELQEPRQHSEPRIRICGIPGKGAEDGVAPTTPLALFSSTTALQITSPKIGSVLLWGNNRHATKSLTHRGKAEANPPRPQKRMGRS